MLTWPEFYKGRLLSSAYLAYFEEHYRLFVNMVRHEIKPGDRVVEVGCGLATTTKIIHDNKSERPFSGFHCYDASPEMVQLARMNLEDACPVDLADCRVPTGCKPDIIHSHGLLEHMPDYDIQRTIDAHEADDVRVAIHYVPGERHGTPSRGDERLLPLRYWVDTFKPTGSWSFNDDTDYILLWKF